MVLPVQVRLSWPGLPVNGSGACSGDVAWPVLDGVVILGTSPADPASFSMQVRSTACHFSLHLAYSKDSNFLISSHHALGSYYCS